ASCRRLGPLRRSTIYSGLAAPWYCPRPNRGSMEANDVSLAEKVRRRLDAGELPREHFPKTWAGFGNGESCWLRHQTICPAQVMQEGDCDETPCRFHGGCHGWWVGALIHRGLYNPE